MVDRVATETPISMLARAASVHDGLSKKEAPLQ